MHTHKYFPAEENPVYMLTLPITTKSQKLFYPDSTPEGWIPGKDKYRVAQPIEFPPK
jgi:hypothetical protein